MRCIPDWGINISASFLNNQAGSFTLTLIELQTTNNSLIFKIALNLVNRKYAGTQTDSEKAKKFPLGLTLAICITLIFTKILTFYWTVASMQKPIYFKSSNEFRKT